MHSFIDTHAHLDYPDFSGDLEQIVERAQLAGVGRIITVGTDLESSARAIRLSERFPQVYAAIGWHPSDADKAPEDLRPALREMAGHPKVVAIGETGLDYCRLPSRQGTGDAAADERTRQKQRQALAQQLEVAAEFGLNCIIHQRESFAAVMECLRPYAGKLRVVFHCFVDDAEVLARILAWGGLVSYTGIATFKNAEKVRAVLAATPLGKFMLETDCPFLAPMPHRGKRCEPAYLRDTAVVAAAQKNCSLDELAAATTQTADEFFPKCRV